MKEDQPKKIGNYRIIKTLGEGAMARVYLAELAAEGGFRRKCALKVVHPEFARDRKFIELMQREARLGALLEHPNIVNTISHGDFDGVHYIDLEYVEGKTLAEFLEMMDLKGRSGLDLGFCLQIILPILRGLHYAHNFSDESWEGPPGMVHRDLKPANVMLSNQAVVKIMDFGIAKAKASRTNLTSIGQVRGTPVYMAPEQVIGKEVDGRSDQFAAASVFYELVTGKKLFSGINLISVMQAVANAQTGEAEDLLETACPGLSAVLGKMWERRPEDRFEHCDDAADAVADVLATYLEGPIARKPPKRLGRAGKKRRQQSHKAKPAIFGLLSALTSSSKKKGRKRPESESGSPAKRRRRKKKRSTPAQSDASPVVESAEDWFAASARLGSTDSPEQSEHTEPSTDEVIPPQSATSNPDERREAADLGTPPAGPDALIAVVDDDTIDRDDTEELNVEVDEGKTISVLFMNVIFDGPEHDVTTRDVESVTTVRDQAILSQDTLSPIELLDPTLDVPEAQQISAPASKPEDERLDRIEQIKLGENRASEDEPSNQALVTDSIEANLTAAALEPGDSLAELPTMLDDTEHLFQSTGAEPLSASPDISDTLDLSPLARPSTPAKAKAPTGKDQRGDAVREPAVIPDGLLASPQTHDNDEGDLDDFFSGEGKDEGKGEEDESDGDDFFSDNFDD